MEYVDFVIVNIDDEKKLYKAPEFSHLQKDDMVTVPTMVVAFPVVASDSFIADDNDPTVKMILNIFEYENIESVPKLTAKVNVIKFDWAERG